MRGLMLSALLLFAAAATGAPAPVPKAKRASETVWHVRAMPLSATQGTLVMQVQQEGADLAVYFELKRGRVRDAYYALRGPRSSSTLVDLPGATSEPLTEAVLRAVESLG